MCKKIRVAAYIKTAIEEMELAEQMSEPIIEPDDFGKNLSGMTIFRACSMSIQCITENFIKVRNNTKNGFFKSLEKKKNPTKQPRHGSFTRAKNT